jgi:hypothetical protein
LSDPNGQNGGPWAPRLATPNPVRAIQTIARHQGVDLRPLLDAEFNAKPTEKLTVVEASLLIDQLKSSPIPDDTDSTADHCERRAEEVRGGRWVARVVFRAVAT